MTRAVQVIGKARVVERRDQLSRDCDSWIELYANSANTQNYYQPFNSTEVGADLNQAVATTNQQAQAYGDWLTTAIKIKVGINGITQYQWGQTRLESQSGSVVDDSNDYHKPDGSDSSNGYSPDDGYAVY
ncbi:hypothetical protein FRC02_004637 [Tulasnella sp. 418]|nr:hypothetical protein FRC02_004637 [Tulasnella sp. 418]